MGPFAAPIAMAVLGAIAGSQRQSQSTTQSRNVGGATSSELAATGLSDEMLKQLNALVQQGPGAEAQTGAAASTKSLQDLLSQFASGGFVPGQADVQQANQFASSVYQPQQVAQEQQFAQQQQRAAQLASQLGRPVNDPYIQAKLSQEYMQGQERLGAERGSFAAQYAQQLPQQRLGYTAQLADINNSLASQAMANRQAILSLGQSVQNSERSFRLGAAPTTQTATSGGGLGGALTGAISGAGAGFGVANAFNQLGAATMPTQQAAAASMPLQQSTFAQPYQFGAASFAAPRPQQAYFGSFKGG